MKARHILVKTKKEAEAIIKRLNKKENFEEIAKKTSTDGSAAVEGILAILVMVKWLSLLRMLRLA